MTALVYSWIIHRRLDHRHRVHGRESRESLGKKERDYNSLETKTRHNNAAAAAAADVARQ